MKQLAELHLGSSTKKADSNYNTFTVEGFETMLRTLKSIPKLTTLDMQLQHVKDLNISYVGIYLLLTLGIGDRGAQFVA
jgi:hypothetical protein